jgi:hypothetical protein
LKTYAVFLVAIVMGGVTLKTAGPSLPVVVASIAAMAEWSIAAESVAMYAKYRFPDRFGDKKPDA